MGDIDLFDQEQVLGALESILPMAAAVVVSLAVIVGIDRWFAKRPRSLARPATMAGPPILIY